MDGPKRHSWAVVVRAERLRARGWRSRLSGASVAVWLAVTGWAADASAHGGDQPTGSNKKELANPFRGSTLTLDQSVTTQTADVGNTPQTYAPLYELWFSLRPRYWLGEHWVFRGRFDYTKQLTNNQQAADYPTTNSQADVFGDIWTEFLYATGFDSLWPGTSLLFGPRALWPTSQPSQANGTYVTLGAVVDATHTFDIRGDAAPSLNNARLRLVLGYTHPFSTATTPTYYGNFAYVREDVDDHSFVSDQIAGQTLVNHRLGVTLDTGLQITPKLSALADVILINEWRYSPVQSPCVATLTGCAAIPSGGDHPFVQQTWLVLGLDYALVDEVDIGLGYYNLANAIAPDGHRRGVFGTDNIWWSPDARFFFDVTANLDALFDDAMAHKYSIKEAAQQARRTRVAY
jgi:hypothetical protein